MKKMWFAVLVAALALTGCASGGGYIAEVRDKVPGLVDEYGETQLAELGEAVCTALDDGATGHDAAGTLESNGFTLAEAGTVVLAASDHLCPEHAAAVN